MKKNWLMRWGELVSGKKGRWITILIWVFAIILLNITLPQANSQKNERADLFLEKVDSQKAKEIIEKNFGNKTGTPALLTWYKKNQLSDEDLASIQTLTKKLVVDNPIEGTEVPPFYQMALPVIKQQVSKDGTTFVLPVIFDQDLETAEIQNRLDKLKQISEPIFSSNPFTKKISDENSLLVRVTGPAGISVDATKLFSQGDLSLLFGTVLLVLVFLLIIYRSPILALIPLISVGMAYMVISPILGLLGKEGVIDFDSQAISIMTVLLFGAGTDYCLFLIAQFRNSLKTEESKFRSIKHAFTRSSGAIIMSGLTVVISLLVLLGANYGSIHRFAIPFSLAILIMMCASLTLIPAFLSILGRASFYPFIPRTEEMDKKLAEKRGKVYRDRKKEKRLGNIIGRMVSQNPWKVFITTFTILGILAIYSLKIDYTYDTLSSFPKNMPSREGFEILSEHFSAGDLAPTQVIVKGIEDENSVKEKLEGLPYIAKVSDPERSKRDPSLVKYDVELIDNPYSNKAMESIPKLKKELKEILKSGGAKSKIYISGQTAEQYDTKETTKADSSLIIPIVLVMIAVLLLFYLRSIIATIYLIGTVLLSYYSALGLGWIILHYGFNVNEIQGFIPLYAFVFIVALGEDYNIFMISSIWRKSNEMSLVNAVREGVAETGGIITSAGLILAGTFAILTTLPIQILVHFGTITAIGVLLDTFIIRPFLVPAITSILGKWAFWPVKKKMGEVEKLQG
ncbi:MMPL family transporter [Bacillus sp. UNC438CL73TsuS30]|uniref:MMPL family transporter n=1 Tax=Bacillus sp. UNC438CL73TsuS30 TaxID=1340434 RepID=UPI00047C7637|nr:MMPL family transporter [Bacillus sp. UNC438CL73TsuS30]